MQCVHHAIDEQSFEHGSVITAWESRYHVHTTVPFKSFPLGNRDITIHNNRNTSN